MKNNVPFAVSLTVVAAGLAVISLHSQEKKVQPQTKATVHYINGPRDDAAIPRPGMIASDVWSTAEAVTKLTALK